MVELERFGVGAEAGLGDVAAEWGVGRGAVGWEWVRGVTKGMWRRERPGQGEEQASGPGAPRPSMEADGKTKWRGGNRGRCPGVTLRGFQRSGLGQSGPRAGSRVGLAWPSPAPDGRLAEGSAREGSRRGLAGRQGASV